MPQPLLRYQARLAPLENLPISPSPNGPSEGENSTNRLETSQGTSYLDYTNIKFGLKLKYPSTVTVTEEELASNSSPRVDIVKFGIPNSDALINIFINPQVFAGSIREVADARYCQILQRGS